MPGIPQIHQEHVDFDLLGQANGSGAMIVLAHQPGGGKSALLRARCRPCGGWQLSATV
jgi:hypothetical protein